MLFGREDVYYLPVGETFTEEKIREYLNQLFQVCGMVSVPDIKGMLSYVKEAEQTKVFDSQIAAYLLNPLKSNYTYDDIAKEFAGEILTTAEDLFGSSKLPKFCKVDPGILASYGGYMAYSAYCSKEPLTQRLKDLGMYQLYREVEIPLAFTLYDMEKAGIRAEGEALKTYVSSCRYGLQNWKRDLSAGGRSV